MRTKSVSAWLRVSISQFRLRCFRAGIRLARHWRFAAGLIAVAIQIGVVADGIITEHEGIILGAFTMTSIYLDWIASNQPPRPPAAPSAPTT